MVAGWDGQLSGIAVQPHSKCFKSEVAITDALGRFSLSEFAAKMNPFIVNQHRTIGIYKPGFQEVSRSEDSRRFEVIRRMDSNPKEFDDVRGSYLPLGCGVDDRKLVPVMKALAAELAQLARTTKQKEQVGDMLFNIDFIEGGQEEAFRKAQQRRAAAKREGAGK